MLDYIQHLGSWNWFILAAILLLAELAAPGVFLIWLGIAAALTGLITLIADFGWQIDIVIFAILSVILVLLLRPRFKSRFDVTDQPNLNQRMFNYVGRTFTLATPIVDGRGRLTIDDTVWEIEGADAAAGQKVKVTGVDGTRLKVDPA
jgi:hypothetical protein